MPLASIVVGVRSLPDVVDCVEPASALLDDDDVALLTSSVVVALASPVVADVAMVTANPYREKKMMHRKHETMRRK